MVTNQPEVSISVMLAVEDATAARAWYEKALGSRDPVRDHDTPWGRHRQGSFDDPYGHRWLVGDRSPLSPH